MPILDIIDSDLQNGLVETLACLSPITKATERTFRERIARGVMTFVALIDDKVVGTASLFVEPKFIHDGGLVGHIEDVAVLPEFQGMGVGQNLVEHCVEQARLAGCYKVILDCKHDLIPFYEQSGFKVSGYQMRLDFPR